MSHLGTWLRFQAELAEKNTMKSFVLALALGIIVALVAGCSKGGAPRRQIALNIDLREDSKLQSSSVPPTPTERWAARAIVSATELQCYGIAVSAPGEDANSCMTTTGDQISFASLHGFKDKSVVSEIEVTPGASRKLFIFGIRMAPGESCPSLANFSPRRSSQIRIIGEAKLDVAKGENVIKVPVSFDGALVDDCEGPVLPPEVKSVARCNYLRPAVVTNTAGYLPHRVIVHFQRDQEPIESLSQMQSRIPSATQITHSWKHMDSYMIGFDPTSDLASEMDRLCALEGVSYVEPVDTIPYTSFSVEATGPAVGAMNRIAILGTGLSANHDRYNGANFFQATDIPSNGIDDDGDGFIDNQNGVNWLTASTGVTDDAGDGTQVMGAVAIGAGYDMVAPTGAWTASPFKIIGEKVLDQWGGGSLLDAASAIEHARSVGSRIIVLPLGKFEDSLLLRRALHRASAADILVVSAAGSSGLDLSLQPVYPAVVQTATNLVVGSIAPNGSRSAFSNFGTAVGIYAPGNMIFTTNPGNGYSSVSGTSYSAGQIAGVAAMISQSQPNLTAHELKRFLESSWATTGIYQTLPAYSGAATTAPRGLTPPMEFYPE